MQLLHAEGAGSSCLLPQACCLVLRLQNEAFTCRQHLRLPSAAQHLGATRSSISGVHVVSPSRAKAAMARAKLAGGRHALSLGTGVREAVSFGATRKTLHKLCAFVCWP